MPDIIEDVPQFGFAPGAASVGAPAEFGMASSYQWNHGLLPLPVAGPPGRPLEIVRVHAPFCLYGREFQSESRGGKPVLPSPDTTQENEVLLQHCISPGAPVTEAPGVSRWTVGGRYLYALILPPGPSDNLMAGSVIDTVTPTDANVVDPGQFVRELVGPAPLPSSSNQLWTYGNDPSTVAVAAP